MHTSVRRDQFDTRGNTIVHAPTGAEFTANPCSRDSFLIWTGELGRNLPNGDSYSYADVLGMMKSLWREGAFESTLSAKFPNWA
jgi:hypothetical protein